MSEFVKEILKNKYDVSFLKNKLSHYFVETASCPECSVGSLVPREGKYGLFYACSLGKKYCDTTLRPCPSCMSAPLLRNRERHYCASTQCDFQAPSCPICDTGRLLTRVNNTTGEEFLGCSNYRGDKPGSCKYSCEIESLEAELCEEVVGYGRTRA